MDKVVIFNGSGYEVWSGEMKTLFRACGVWDLVDKGYKEKGRTKKGLEIDTRVDNTVLLVIKQKVSGPAALCIASAEKSKEAWNILERKYKGMDHPILTTIFVRVKIGELVGKMNIFKKKRRKLNPFEGMSERMDKVVIFNGSGYEVWSGEMKTLFRACGVWDLVDKGYKEKGRTKKGLEIDTRVDNTVLLVIKQKVSGPAALCIASAEKSKEAWNILERKYKGMDHPILTTIFVRVKIGELVGKMNIFKKKRRKLNPFEGMSELMDKVVIFNGSGYEVWSGEMKTLFRACGVWDLVDKGYKEKGRTKKGLEIDTRVDNTVLLVIKQKVSGPAALCIASERSQKRHGIYWKGNIKIRTGQSCVRNTAFNKPAICFFPLALLSSQWKSRNKLTIVYISLDSSSGSPVQRH
nr:calmodulin-like protein 2 isoform X2 [Ipomoea batatas]